MSQVGNHSILQWNDDSQFKNGREWRIKSYENFPMLCCFLLFSNSTVGKLSFSRSLKVYINIYIYTSAWPQANKVTCTLCLDGTNYLKDSALYYITTTNTRNGLEKLVIHSGMMHFKYKLALYFSYGMSCSYVLIDFSRSSDANLWLIMNVHMKFV